MPNPFEPNAPVTAMEKFIGRGEYVQEILSGIRTPVSYAVIGGRRIGKTSLLNYLVQRIAQENRDASDLTCIPIATSLHLTTPQNRRGFFNALLRRLVRYLNSEHNFGLSLTAFTLPPINEEDFDLEEVLDLLLDLIQHGMTRLGDIRFVFLIDELDKRVYYTFAKPEDSDSVSLSIKELRTMFSSESLGDSLDKLFYHGLLHKLAENCYLAILGLFAEWFRGRFTEIEANLTFNLDLDAYNVHLAVVKKRYSRGQTDAQGKALEELGKFLLESCSGLRVEPREITAQGEIDLLVQNRNRSHPLLSTLGDFICECKNLQKKAGIQLIQTFRHRINAFDCQLGLYFSRRGITVPARNQIYEFYSQEKRYLVALDLNDFERIGQGADFLEMLEEKMRDIRFQRLSR